MADVERHPLRAWRARKGITLRQLVELLERKMGKRVISYVSLARIERGLQPPSSAVMRAVFEVTDGEVTPNGLLGCGMTAERSSACMNQTP
jgi:transcriptional regulator with XRE-family HTH domain